MNAPFNFTDAMQANLAFVVKQSSSIEAGVYRHKYPDLNYEELIPVDTSAHPFATSVTYYSMDGAGRANWINGNGKDIPVANAELEQFETPVHTAGIGYSFGFEEVGRAQMLGVSLESEKAFYARRAYEEFVYRVSFQGDTLKGFNGLYNYPGVPAANLPNDGTGTSRLWSTKSPDLIIRDVNSALMGINSATERSEMADTLILPWERMELIASTRLTDTSMTILQFLQSQNIYTATTGQPLTIRGKRGLLTAGDSGTARMIAYRRSPEVLKIHIPMPHRFMPVQIEGLQYTVPGVFRLGGLDIRLPKAVIYRDGL
jgi:hypothetical protein